MPGSHDLGQTNQIHALQKSGYSSRLEPSGYKTAGLPLPPTFDFSLGAKGSVFKGSATGSLATASLLPVLLPPPLSISLSLPLCYSPLFIFSFLYRLAAVDSFGLYPAYLGLGKQSLWLYFKLLTPSLSPWASLLCITVDFGIPASRPRKMAKRPIKLKGEVKSSL